MEWRGQTDDTTGQTDIQTQASLIYQHNTDIQDEEMECQGQTDDTTGIQTQASSTHWHDINVEDEKWSAKDR